MSVYTSAFLTRLTFARPVEPGIRKTDLPDILYWGGFLVKYVQKIDTRLKYDKNNKKFIWRTKYIYD